jgi:SAM-dependent methyltransferase
VSATGNTALDNHLGGSAARNYRRFEFDLIAPHCGRRVCEVGAGLGEFAAEFAGLERLVVTDTDPLCLAALRRRFAGRADVEVLGMDLAGEVGLAAPVDTVVSLNVLEHLADDAGALRKLAGLVVPGGRVVAWVPGYDALYGDFDRAVGHYRRYTPASARRLADFAGLAVEVARPVNLLGGIAWWATVRLGRQGEPSPRLVRAYDRVVVPATRALERRVPVPFGQSVLLVARVP